MKTAVVSRYHPLLATLHWLLAVLIIAMLCIGFLVLAPMPSIDPQKIGILLVHMSIGMAILALMVARFIVRIRTSRPADATTGYPRLDRLAPIDLAWDCRVCWDEAENVVDGEGFWGQDRIELLADALKSGRAPHRSQA
jgi:hypothetical protein